MIEHYISNDELNELAELVRRTDGQSGSKAVSDFFRKLHSEGVTHVARQLSSQRADFSEKKSVLEKLGLPLIQSKQAFVRKEPGPPVQVTDRLLFRSFPQVGKEAFLSTVVRCHHHTLDRAMKLLVREQESRSGDLTEHVSHELDAISNDFDFEFDWWQLAYADGDRLVGYVQPVLFRGGKKGQLGEGTIYYIGVVPEARGNGYIRDILAKGVSVLQGAGVWQIYCDTDCENHPTVNACRALGFEEDGINHIWKAGLNELLEGRARRFP